MTIQSSWYKQYFQSNINEREDGTQNLGNVNKHKYRKNIGIKFLSIIPDLHTVI